MSADWFCTIRTINVFFILIQNVLLLYCIPILRKATNVLGTFLRKQFEEINETISTPITCVLSAIKEPFRLPFNRNEKET